MPKDETQETINKNPKPHDTKALISFPKNDAKDHRHQSNSQDDFKGHQRRMLCSLCEGFG